MEKSIFEQMGGTYRREVDYLIPNLELPESEDKREIGSYGRQHLEYIKKHHYGFYYQMLTSGKLNSYLSDINKQAEEMYHRLIKEMAEKQGVMETLKAEKLWEWIGLMNNIQAYAREVVNSELIYA